MRRPLLPLLLLLALLLPVTALAAPQQADYDIYVNAKDNLGLNLRTGAGTEYAKVLPDPIPMYTKLHITQTDTSSTGAKWGYTTYNGSSGWVCLVETTTYDPRGTQTTAQTANYDIYVNAKDNLGLNLRTGAGTEYAKVLPDPIPMYTKLHISQTDTSSTGAKWGYTTYDGSSGWVCLVETTTYDPQGNETVVPHEDTEIEMEPALEEVENPANGGETSADASGVTVNVNVNGDSDDTGDSTNSSAKTLLLGAAGGVVVLLLALGVTAATRKKKD
jgi:hypothetical protein